MSRVISAYGDGPAGGTRPGRPPVFSESERTRRILEAAERVFTTAGYGAATMEEVARVAGMSKKTVYARYPDKGSLLAALVTAADDSPWENDGAPMAHPVAELRRRLVAMIEFMLSRRQLRLTRLLISQAEQAPDLADFFHARVMMKSRVYIAAALERARPQGFGVRENTLRVADALIGAALGERHIHALLGRSDGLGRKRIAAQVDLALRIFGLAGG